MVEDNLRWKATFEERQPLVEDNLWWKTTFGGRQPSGEAGVVTPPHDIHSTTRLELLSAVSTRNRICHQRKMYAALYMHTCAEKTTFLAKED